MHASWVVRVQRPKFSSVNHKRHEHTPTDEMQEHAYGCAYIHTGSLSQTPKGSQLPMTPNEARRRARTARRGRKALSPNRLAGRARLCLFSQRAMQGAGSPTPGRTALPALLNHEGSSAGVPLPVGSSPTPKGEKNGGGKSTPQSSAPRGRRTRDHLSATHTSMTEHTPKDECRNQ